MHFESTILPIAIMGIIFGSPVAIVAIVMLVRSRERADVQKTLRAAIERGEALPADLLDNLRAGKKPRTPMNDIRAGIILMAIGGGFMAWNYISSGRIGGDMAGIAALLGLIGVALLLLGVIGSATRKN